MEVGRSSEKSVSYRNTTRCYNPEERYLHTSQQASFGSEYNSLHKSK